MSYQPDFLSSRMSNLAEDYAIVKVSKDLQSKSNFSMTNLSVHGILVQ